MKQSAQPAACFLDGENRMIQDSSGYNPFLAEGRGTSPVAGKPSNDHAAPASSPAPAALAPVPQRGAIDAPGRAVGNLEENIIWQTRDHAATDYENRLGDAIESAFEADANSPEAMAAHLNGMGVHAPDGAPWTAASFEAVMRELGA
jgi:hypothetical protein